MLTQKEKITELKKIINSNQNITERQKRNIGKEINTLFAKELNYKSRSKKKKKKNMLSFITFTDPERL